MTLQPSAQPLHATPSHDQPAPAVQCLHCAQPLLGRQERFCGPRCRLADWESRNPRLREDAPMAEVRAVLRAYFARRLGHGGRFRVRY